MSSPLRGVILAYDAADQIGRIRTDDGTEVRFGASACNGFAPQPGLAVHVIEAVPHPLGGLRARVVNTTGVIEADRVTTALREAQDRERAGGVVQLQSSDYARARQGALDARERAYSSLGHLEPYVFSTFWPESEHIHHEPAPAIIQTPHGERYDGLIVPKVQLPMWPAGRSAFRVVRRGSRTMIITDGLSDPFDPELHAVQSPIGHGFELVAETDEHLGEADPSDLFPGQHLNDSWLNDVLIKASIFAVEHGGLLRLLAKFGFVTAAIPPCPPLDPYVGPEGYVGVLFGVRAPDLPAKVALPAGTIDIVSVKLIQPRDYEHSVQLGNAGVSWLADRYTRSGELHLSRLIAR